MKASTVNEPTARSMSACADGLALPRSSYWRPKMLATLATIVRPEVMMRPAALAKALSKAFSACWYRFASHFARRAAIKTLGELDDRALRDIGLLRCQIESAVHGFMTNPDRGRM